MIEFVETSVSRRINNIIALAREMTTNAAIVGAPGVGKTMSMRAYASRHHEVQSLTITPVLSGSLRALLEDIGDRLGIYCRGGICEVEKKIKNYYFLDKVFIIDEAQNLPLKSLRQLLHLSVAEDGPINFIFCGNNEVLKRVNTDQGAFAQISRRVGFREVIDSISDDDADTLTNVFGVEGLETYQLMRDIGGRFHADGVVRVLEVARRIADQTSQTVIRVPQIRAALELLPQYQSALSTKSKRHKAVDRTA